MGKWQRLGHSLNRDGEPGDNRNRLEKTSCEVATQAQQEGGTIP